jgi:c-di-GMP-binding flagellar brake protein YcgR
MGETSTQQGVPDDNAFVKRRKHPRHTLLQDIKIIRPNSAPFHACTFEISLGGLSLATSKDLEIGEVVVLSPVVGTTVTAAIRRRSGALYGLEFLNLDDTIKAKIAKLCESLPLFQSLVDS